MARNLFEAFARAGQTGLGVAANNVIPMHQYNQRMARDEEERASMENWRQQQLAQDEEERASMENWRQQQLAQDESQFQRQQKQAQWKTMMDLWGEDVKRGPNYGRLKPSDIPGSVGGLMSYALYNNDPDLIKRVTPYYNEMNSIEDRPVREPAEKRPPNYASKFTSRMEDLWNNYTYQNQLPEGQRRPGLTQPNPEQVFSREFEPEAAGYGLNTDSIRTLVNLQPRGPQAFGNSDKMLSPHRMGPQAGQKLTPNEDSWGAMQFDDWNDLTADEKAAVIRKARSEGKL